MEDDKKIISLGNAFFCYRSSNKYTCNILGNINKFVKTVEVPFKLLEIAPELLLITKRFLQYHLISITGPVSSFDDITSFTFSTKTCKLLVK